MTFEIQNTVGTFVDITPYLFFQGLSYQLSDVDAPNSGRTLAGTMERAKISDKDKWKLKFRPLTTEEMSIVIDLITHQYVTVRYLSPRTNAIVVKTMYPGDRTATHCIYRKSGETLWHDLSFSLIER